MVTTEKNDFGAKRGHKGETMTREIKFRVWDTDEKTMDYSGDLYDFESAYSFFRAQEDAEITNNIILMQYAGLLDKNGKEIYEGDIISCKTNAFRNAENMEVFYAVHEGAYGLRDSTGKIGGHLLFYHIGTPEVIGNIYENPELLAGDKHGNDRKE